MMQVRPIRLDELQAVEYECECGSMGRLTIDGREKSVTCAIYAPELTIRVLMKVTDPGTEPAPGPIDDVLIIEEL